MQQEWQNKIQFLTASAEVLSNLEEVCGTTPFAEETVCFLDELSAALNHDPAARRYSDIVTFAFWCRKANILRLKKQYADLPDRRGRGLTFHIAPSNIPMMFAFSLAVSLLAGNANVMRLSSKEFPQTGIVCRHLNHLLDTRYKEMRERVVILTYPHDEQITEYFSGLCDNRIIWGGDRSVNEIRRFPLRPYAIDLPFYDRFSFAVVDVDSYLAETKKEALAKKFYDDTYLTDQNACTSPQLLVWLARDGDQVKVELAKKTFWSELQKIVDKKYGFQDVQAVDKLCALAGYAAAHPGGKAVYEDMTLVRVEIGELDPKLKDYRCPGGYFYEYFTNDLRRIRTVCTKECQTIAYFGVTREEILQAVDGCRGVDRIVPIGNTMDFGLKWDGFDFIDSLTKIIA